MKMSIPVDATTHLFDFPANRALFVKPAGFGHPLTRRPRADYTDAMSIPPSRPPC